MNTPRFLLCLPLILIASVSQAQLLCTPTGGPFGGSQYCGGWDGNMNNRSIGITPLPGGSSMLTDLTPRRTEPIVIERSRFAESLLSEPYRSAQPSRRASPRTGDLDTLLQRSAPLSENSRMQDDDLPLPPFPE